MDGAAATCLTEAPQVPGPVPSALGGAVGAAVAPCNASQAADAQAQFSMLGGFLHCDAVVSHSTGRPDSENPGSSSSTSTGASAGAASGAAPVSKNGLRWVGGLVSVGAVVLAAVSAL
jgi:hypothetical protein